MEGRVDEGRHARLNARAEAVIALKESTEAASSAMRSSNARRQERLDEVAKQREEEKYAILAKGGNPYQVFRQRDEDARLARERKRMQKELEANMTNLQERIIKDYQIEAKERATAEQHKTGRRGEGEVHLVRRQGAGQHAVHGAVTKKHVTCHRPDVQGALPAPVEHMTVKSRPDWKFGLGMGADPDIIDHIAAKYPDVTAEANVRAEAKRQAAVALATASRSRSNRPSPRWARLRSRSWRTRRRPRGRRWTSSSRPSRRGCGRSGSRRKRTR